MAGREIARPDADENAGPNAPKGIDQSIAVTNPRLWSPDDPHLYQLVSIVSEGGRTTDRYQTPFGIRFMSHDPAHGFTFNGKPIVQRGVDRRQDYGFLGDALLEAIGVKDLA